MSQTTRPNVSDREFIKANLEMQNSSIEEIAERLGLKPSTVQQRRVRINKQGNILPKLPRGKRNHSVDYAAIAAEVQAELDAANV